jgi:hypothetical protein
MLKIELVHELVQCCIVQQLIGQWDFNEGSINIQFDHNKVVLVEIFQYHFERIQRGSGIRLDTDIDPMISSHQVFRNFLKDIGGFFRSDFVRINVVERKAKLPVKFRQVHGRRRFSGMKIQTRTHVDQHRATGALELATHGSKVVHEK